MENNNINLRKLLYSLPVYRLFYISFFILLILVSLIASVITFANEYTTTLPAMGGTFNMATINNIRYLDPIFSSNETEIALSKLLYSGIMRHEDNKYINDLAESIEPSADGYVYKIHLKHARFSDGTTLTSSDVAYTIELLADTLINSPHHKDWKNVTTNVIDNYTIEIRFKSTVNNVPQLLTQGIIKKSEWVTLPKGSLSLSNLNINGTGSGPYKLFSTTENNKIINNIKFVINDNYKYVNPLPYIENLNVQIYANNLQIYDEIRSGYKYFTTNIDPSVITSLTKANSDLNIESVEMFRTFGLFFNPNNDKNLANLDYRLDLKNSINKQEIIAEVLSGYGRPVSSIYNMDFSAKVINSDLIKNNYSGRTISIYTLNNPDLLKVANIIKSYWANIGVVADIKQFEYGEFQQDVIKNRNFSVLLFAIDTNDSNDIYNLWNSSGRNYPGTNITNYFSTTLDTNLENLITATDTDVTKAIYQNINDELEKNIAWIPLYTPYVIYSFDKGVNMPKVTNLEDKKDVLDNLVKAYINKEKVYNIFSNDTFYKKLSDFIH